MSTHPILVIGAGPAGLSAADELSSCGVQVVIVESDAVVGGLSRTVVRDGWRFDIGGHRFYSKSDEVIERWKAALGSNLVRRPRRSRIAYRNRWFRYPLEPLDALRGLGFAEAIRCAASYVAVRVRRPANQDTFEGWVAARFGWRLYRTFFQTYTEKVWGVPAASLPADWARQRIKNLTLVRALLPRRFRADVTSLIEEFWYPRLGPGMMWEAYRDRLVERGVAIHMNTRIDRLERERGRVVAACAGTRRWRCDAVISTMPLGELIAALDPPAPAPVLEAARSLRHRDFLTVALVIDGEIDFPDTWIYIHDPHVRVGRVQNYANWSPDMVAEGTTCLGLEYFVTEGDALWNSSDDDLITLARREVKLLALARPEQVSHGYVVRMSKAYPVYQRGYREAVEVVRTWLAAEVPNLQVAGRNGMHRYNNQDHSMLTGIAAAKVLIGDPETDPWNVTVGDDYLETGRDAPIVG